jgi:hypothetical protein
MKYKLHYASTEMLEDIPCYELNGEIELASFILAETTTNIIYLVSVLDEVYVTDNIAMVIHFINLFAFKKDVINAGNMLGLELESANLDVFLQEYESFEEAYEVSLDMQEIKDNCYKA